MSRPARSAQPGRPATRRPGLRFLPLGLAALLACDRAAEPRPGTALRLGSGTVQLAPGSQIHELLLHAGRHPEFAPDTARARSGDVVRFTAADAAGHAVAFDEQALEPAALAFLRATRQLRGPPLLDAGASWIVSLAGAPPGAYPFLCLGHDGRGLLLVRRR